MSAKPEGHDSAVQDAGSKPGLVARLLGPLKAVTGLFGKLGKIGASCGGVFRIIPKSLAWAKSHKLVAIVALTVIFVGGNGIAWWMLRHEEAPPPPPETIQDALLALDKSEWDAAKRIIETVSKNEHADFDTWGGVPFVQATIELYQREQAQSEGSLVDDVRIAGLLQTARERGFPEGRRAQGLYLLGRVLARTGQYAAARGVLEEAIEAGAPPKAILLPLSEAWSVGPRPDYGKARRFVHEYLAESSLTDAERQWGYIELARQQLGQGDLAACRKTLASFEAAREIVPASKLLLGRAALNEARAIPGAASGEPPSDDPKTKLYQQVLETLRQVGGQEASAMPWRRLSLYFAGVCLAELGKPDDAIRQFSRLRQQFSSSYEALFAGLEEAELLRSEGRDEEAIGLMASVFKQLPASDEIAHPHLPDLAPRERIRRDYDAYLQKPDYLSAIQLLNAGTTALGEETTWELKSALYQRWGGALLAAAGKEAPQQGEALAQEGRRHLRQAGAAFSELAARHFSHRRYPDDVWNSAEAFAAGRDYVNAAEQYRKYIEFNTPRRRAEALYGMANARLADGKLTEALEAVTEAIRAYPRNPGVYAARLLASRIYSELADGVHAEEMLRANLEGGQLAPESNEWRDSLFALGSLLYREGRPGEALAPLGEAVRRWPNAPQSIDAYYLLAECNRQQADQLRSAALAANVPSERAARFREVDAHATAAFENYERVRGLLEQRSDRELLPPIDQATLRNCYFGRGAMLQQLSRFEEAVQAYSDATNRYQSAPEALDAYVQAAECLRRLNRAADARGTLEQAKVALARIAPDADFAATTNFSRDEWAKELDWLSKNL